MLSYRLDKVKRHYRSEVFVCVATNRADAVDPLLILIALCLMFQMFERWFGKRIIEQNIPGDGSLFSFGFTSFQ